MIDWQELALVRSATLKTPTRKQATNATDSEKQATENKIGGIFRNGDWAWLTNETTLEIISLKDAELVSVFEFSESRGYGNYAISCVEAICAEPASDILLAVCLESKTGRSNSLVAVYSVQEGCVLGNVQLPLRITCCKQLTAACCRRLYLVQSYDGCLLLGSTEGMLVFLDLRLEGLFGMFEDTAPTEKRFSEALLADYYAQPDLLRCHYEQCRKQQRHLALALEEISENKAISSLLPIELSLSLAVGLENGQLLCFGLDSAAPRLYWRAQPAEMLLNAPIVQMQSLVASDDPLNCHFICTVHEDDESLHVALHMLNFADLVNDIYNGEQLLIYEHFKSGHTRLLFPLENRRCRFISCQSLSNSSVQQRAEESNALYAFFWYSEQMQCTKLFLFDLHQWYREQMPAVYKPDQATYVAGYSLGKNPAQRLALHAYINPNTLVHFYSMQGLEEHFYPNTLGFECQLLLPQQALTFGWEGAQNHFLNELRYSEPTIFLDTSKVYKEILNLYLMPQYLDLNESISADLKTKYFNIFSVALENNCYNLLRKCARSWLDGSYTINLDAPSTGLTLSTLTDWIWQRAAVLKKNCDALCRRIFDHNGSILDQREQKQLSSIARQLKLLADLMAEILMLIKGNTPDEVRSTFEHRHKSLRIYSEYQEILLWLLHIGLLPEAGSAQQLNQSIILMPYPYRLLRQHYVDKREFFRKTCTNCISHKTGSCRLVFIDAFLQHECMQDNILREHWLENDGDGLYPPKSIEAMLRLMLLPHVPLDNKNAVLLYFFLDLNEVIDDELYSHITAHFIKFPSVFKLTASLVKTVQAFWNLDHGNFEEAVEAFTSPFNRNKNVPQWLLELFLEALLTQGVPRLAHDLLTSCNTPIAPKLQLQTQLANEQYSDAFHFARSADDTSLLEHFFNYCLSHDKFSVMRNLALDPNESQLLESIFRRHPVPNSENLHLIYLLQKCNYIDAISLLEEISQTRNNRYRGSLGVSHVPDTILTAFNATMTPVTQQLGDVYLRIRNKIRQRETENHSPLPFSSQLIKQNAGSLLGGIYHSSALSTHFASQYGWSVDERPPQQKANGSNVPELLQTNNVPFLRKPQVDDFLCSYSGERKPLYYPQPYKKPAPKRTHAEADDYELNAARSSDREQEQKMNPSKRRCMLSEDVTHNLRKLVESTPKQATFKVKDLIPSIATDDFLTQPPVSHSKVTTHESDMRTPIKNLMASELQGILKTPERSNTPKRLSVCRELLPEVPSVRFNLPTGETMEVVQKEETMQEQAMEDETAQSEKDEDSTDKEEESEKDAFEVIEHMKRRNIARSVSVDSECSSDASTIDLHNSSYNTVNPTILDHTVQSKISTEKDKETSPIAAILAGPSVRKPLNTEASEESDLQAYLTAPSTVETVLPVIEPKSSEFDFKSSSGYSSASIATKYISSVTSIVAMNTREFIPTVSSSKVCETQSKFAVETQAVKLSEKSTVVGSLTGMDSLGVRDAAKDTDESVQKLETSSETKQHLVQLDTTLSMSSYDLTTCDTTHSERHENVRADEGAESASDVEMDEVSAAAPAAVQAEEGSSLSCVELDSTSDGDEDTNEPQYGAVLETDSDNSSAEEQEEVEESDSEEILNQDNSTDAETDNQYDSEVTAQSNDDSDAESVAQPDSDEPTQSNREYVDSAESSSDSSERNEEVVLRVSESDSNQDAAVQSKEAGSTAKQQDVTLVEEDEELISENLRMECSDDDEVEVVESKIVPEKAYETQTEEKEKSTSAQETAEAQNVPLKEMKHEGESEEVTEILNKEQEEKPTSSAGIADNPPEAKKKSPSPMPAFTLEEIISIALTSKSPPRLRSEITAACLEPLVPVGGIREIEEREAKEREAKEKEAKEREARERQNAEKEKASKANETENVEGTAAIEQKKQADGSTEKTNEKVGAGKKEVQAAVSAKVDVDNATGIAEDVGEKKPEADTITEGAEAVQPDVVENEPANVVKEQAEETAEHTQKGQFAAKEEAEGKLKSERVEQIEKIDEQTGSVSHGKDQVVKKQRENEQKETESSRQEELKHNTRLRNTRAVSEQHEVPPTKTEERRKVRGASEPKTARAQPADTQQRGLSLSPKSSASKTALTGFDSPSMRTRRRMRLSLVPENAEEESSMQGSSQSININTSRPASRSSMARDTPTLAISDSREHLTGSNIRTRRSVSRAASIARDTPPPTLTGSPEHLAVNTRMRRSVSRTSVAGDAATTPNVSPVRKKKTRSNSGNSPPGSPKRTGRELAKTVEPASPHVDSPQAGTSYTAARRLTRTQMAALKRSGMEEHFVTGSPEKLERSPRKTVRAGSKARSQAGSDSSQGTTSSKTSRVTRSKAKQMDDDNEDAESVQSSSSTVSKRSTRRTNLLPITETEVEDAAGTNKKRKRANK